MMRSESLFQWVWEANRGNPVGENATLTFGTNGNLVLAHANGKVAWQTNTANKGVVGFKLLPNGNMVLHNSKAGAVSKLVSRASEKENKDGPYSLMNSLVLVTLNSAPETDEGHAYDLTLEYQEANSSSSGTFFLGRPKYNSTSTFLRLGIDGNVKLYTYNDKVDIGAWEVTFALFDRDNSIWETECQLPERCGTFGLCEDSQCSCAPEKLTSCDAKSFHYYKVEGVDHFSSKYTSGAAVKENDCAKKCTSDCKCLGYFFKQDTSRCWIAYDLKTLTKVANSTHVGYIKAPNH
ncbi:epidermis-specific secreted glycoprotein EP1-like [Pyrus ussuriensis x Pyrus communis]|uniref:Epidermis-specific secreted glycoprotein EP1-like n=1 Tax=Pyrus ussuriensis x Pyrus communis TaxID=2448454 RepID=A0A5N5FVE9_9ROSA|nr:epidermis-specific secreted glycoprotein EP1-like [Pyrus ussuriensis x Pyrus communis]